MLPFDILHNDVCASDEKTAGFTVSGLFNRCSIHRLALFSETPRWEECKFSGMTVTIPPQVIPVDQYKHLRLRILFRSCRKMAKGAVI